jgi:hypothetical protein
VVARRAARNESLIDKLTFPLTWRDDGDATYARNDQDSHRRRRRRHYRHRAHGGRAQEPDLHAVRGGRSAPAAAAAADRPAYRCTVARCAARQRPARWRDPGDP